MTGDNRRSRFVRWSGELLVIFLGVSGAFVAEEIREDREQREVAQRVYAALAEELSDHLIVAPRIVDRQFAADSAWLEAAERGERPPPWVPRTGFGQPPRAAWEATLASGGISLIETDLFYSLAKYYDTFESLSVILGGTRDDFIEDRILPHTGQGSTPFYYGDALRPEYQRFMDERRQSLTIARGFLSDAREQLLPELIRRRDG